MTEKPAMNRGNLVRGADTDDGVVVRITPETAGWDYIGFRAVRLPAGGVHSGNSGADEVAIVVIGGAVTVRSDAGTWERIGDRHAYPNSATIAPQGYAHRPSVQGTYSLPKGAAQRCGRGTD